MKRAVLNALFIFTLVASVDKVKGHASRPSLFDMIDRLNISARSSSDEFLFLLVPVTRPLDKSKKDEIKKLVLEPVQVSDAGTAAMPQDAGIFAQRTKGGKTETITKESLDEVFSPNGKHLPPLPFSLQVPMAVPFEFYFELERGELPPPSCSKDSRTWREGVIDRIMKDLEFQDGPLWHQTPDDIRSKIRLMKDQLATIKAYDMEDDKMVNKFKFHLMSCNSEADSLCEDFITASSRTAHVGTGSLPSLAECIDTYQFLYERASTMRAAVTGQHATDLDDIKNAIAEKKQQFPVLP